MDLKIAKKKFQKQRWDAARRGIVWALTFEQWLQWWGDDLDSRGRGPGQLQMQRPADTGPYALGNIRKGVPRQNAVTRGAVVRTKRTLIKAAELDRLRALLPAKIEPPPDETGKDRFYEKMGIRSVAWEPKFW